MQDIFVVKHRISLRALPGWIGRRTFNRIRVNIYDVRGRPLIGLGDDHGHGLIRQGVIQCADDTLAAAALHMVKSCNPKAIEMLDAPMRRTDLGRSTFCGILAEQEQYMPERAAFTAACNILGIDESEGHALLQAGGRR